MNLVIRAKSSSGDPYHVEFTVEESKFTVKCNCRAGIFGKHCKHKAELLAFDEGRLFDTGDAHLLDQLREVVHRATGLHEMSALIAESEKIVRREQKRTKALKNELSQLLKDGVDLR